MSRSHTLLLVVVLGGCAVEEAAPPDDLPDDAPEMPLDPVFAPPRQGMETQGRHLLGAGLDDLAGAAGYHFAVDADGKDLAGNAVRVSLFGGAALQIVGGGLADDVILPGVAGGELAIDLSRAGGGITTYRLRYRATPGAAWEDPCAGGEAVPLDGMYTMSRRHEDVADRITLACADGVAFKCTDWGYAAGAAGGSDAWELHQACTRMANADYCANGETHTREGTTIAIFDEVGINPEPPFTFFGVSQWPPPPGDFYFEAGWRGEDKPAVCLSKLRWQALPPGGPCPLELPDPRIDVNAKFCDDYSSVEELVAVENVVLFNASSYADIALHVWRRGDEVISTIDGYYSDPAVGPGLQPYPGVGPYTWVAADALLLRSLPTSVDPATTVDVHLYTDGVGDLLYLPVTAETLLPAGYTRLGWKGIAFRPPPTGATPPAGVVPLVLYEHQTTGNLVTTTLTAPADYVAIDTVGYLAPIPGK